MTNMFSSWLNFQSWIYGKKVIFMLRQFEKQGTSVFQVRVPCGPRPQEHHHPHDGFPPQPPGPPAVPHRLALWGQRGSCCRSCSCHPAAWPTADRDGGDQRLWGSGTVLREGCHCGVLVRPMSAVQVRFLLTNTRESLVCGFPGRVCKYYKFDHVNSIAFWCHLAEKSLWIKKWSLVDLPCSLVDLLYSDMKFPFIDPRIQN